ncbi:unnamed protein product [Moneuplotes crassus]|uniref:Uncharacterized protein n=1 Tax=Euplotes crassus TaxID=5936 RepID=A0AAD1XES4_EUPCR|nr:unnamed protein product [Moneuplotes crassus]
MKINWPFGKNCENVPEELLCEKATRKEIKTSENMNNKMKMSAFNVYKPSIIGRNNDSDSLIMARQNISCRQTAKLSKNRSFLSEVTKKINQMDESTGSIEDKPNKRRRGYLQKEISYLLRRSAELRKKKTVFATSQMLPSDFSVDDILRDNSFPECSENDNLDKESLYTFGEKC